jgi:hypothetical protein
MDLAAMTLEMVTPLEGHSFEVTLPDGRATRLKLDEVVRYERKVRRTRGTRAPLREPFSLYFLGAPDLVLPQGAYTLRGEAATFEEIFLVPMGNDAEATEYEAIFT